MRRNLNKEVNNATFNHDKFGKGKHIFNGFSVNFHFFQVIEIYICTIIIFFLVAVLRRLNRSCVPFTQLLFHLT